MQKSARAVHESECSGSASQEAVPVLHEEDLFSHSCPSMETLFPNNPSFAKTIRDGYKYLTGVGRAFHPLPVRFVQQQGRAHDSATISHDLIITVCVCACACAFVHREIELPLHDNGMEPLEFLKSMGISLMPLNKAARSSMQKVLGCLLSEYQQP